MENAVDRESAELEFERFLESFRIKKTGFRTKERQQDFDENKELVIDCIMDGTITIDDEGKPTVIVESPDLQFVKFPRRPNGIDKCSMKGPGDDIEKQYSYVASLVGVASAKLKRLDEVDWEKVGCIFQLAVGKRT